MYPWTYDALHELSQCEWFTEVGKPENGVHVLSSWDEAVKSADSKHWKSVGLVALRIYRAKVEKASKNEARQWLKILEDVKPDVRSLVSKKTKDVIERYNLPPTFSTGVNWDILHLCIESEYIQIVPRGFYASLSYWYANGRFPCGWHGAEFPPEGQLTIF
jgi:hypothetical protein